MVKNFTIQRNKPHFYQKSYSGGGIRSVGIYSYLDVYLDEYNFIATTDFPQILQLVYLNIVQNTHDYTRLYKKIHMFIQYGVLRGWIGKLKQFREESRGPLMNY